MMNRLITALFRIGAAFTLAAKRILAQRGLAAATLLGLIATVAITISIPLYSDAVYQQILQKELNQGPAGDVSQASFPPFSFVFRYTGAWNGALQWEDIQPVDTYLSNQAAQVLRLPVKRLVRHMKTDAFRLFPQASAGYTDNQAPLTWGMFGFMTDIQEHISLVEGHYPQGPGPDNSSPIDILVSEALASKLGLQPGEEYIALGDRVTGSQKADVQIPVRISGIWKPSDPQEDYWFIRPETLEDVYIIPEAAYVTRISPLFSGEVYTASWYLQMDGSSVHSSDTSTLIARIHSIQTRAAVLLPKISLDVSPLDSLFQYQKNASNLTILLYAFSIPILLMLLIFTGLIVQMAVERRRNEMAVLRSRGATLWQVVGIAAVEGLILAIATLVIATPIGKQVAEFLGRTQSFLNFSAVSGLHARFNRSIFQVGILVAGLALVAQVIPTIGAAQTTIIAYKQERARQLRQPWWQRFWLDALLFIPAVYGAYLLRQQGSVILPVADSRLPADPFQNPLLFLVPFLGIFAATLFLLRLLPFLMSGLAWLAARTSSVGVLLAARHLSRSPGFYNAPLLLLVLTLSLSTFTASLAQTLDRHLTDQVYYQTGSDIRLLELGNLESAAASSRASSGTAAEGSRQAAGSPRFLLPV
ncbi:MAG: ABC transporter permease, partial [Omnitrophica WOR_2 bacterium]